MPLLIFAGAIGISLAVLGHYLAGAFQRSRNAERRALELQVLAREAELKSLRAQLDPHFLFNSLNSVAALIGNDTAAARQMCFLMAQFFRKSLTLAREQSIPLAEEVSLAETFLAIEKVRFGERLRSQFDIADDVRDVAVPPLMLQPLVENAVHHGVAHLLEGGEVTVQRASPRRFSRARRGESLRSGSAALARHRRGTRERALARRNAVRTSRQRGCRCARRRHFRVSDPVACRQRLSRNAEVNAVRVLIVDDETLARAILAEHLAKLPDVEVVGQAANGFEAVKLAEELNPDLMFLDIQMPKLSGFEVLELLGERAPAVMFTTAFDEFALRAFEVHAVDYLLKPVEPARLAAAVERAARTRAQSARRRRRRRSCRLRRGRQAARWSAS